MNVMTEEITTACKLLIHMCTHTRAHAHARTHADRERERERERANFAQLLQSSSCCQAAFYDSIPLYRAE